MSINWRTRIGGVLILIMLALCAAVAANALQRVRLGGPMHAQVQQASDLIADILPPPVYIIESYLEATQMVARPDELATREARLRVLRKEFDERQAFWKTADLPDEIRSRLIGDADRHARSFFEELDAGTIPAVRRRDPAAMQASYARLSDAYARHRAAIDETVALARNHQSSTLAAADGQLIWSSVQMAAAAAALLGLLAFAIVTLQRTVTTPLARLATVTHDLADGGDADVPFVQRPDELGEIARAIDVFRAATAERATADAAAAADKQLLFDALRDVLDRLASGDLRAQVEAKLAPEYAPIAANLNLAISRLRAMVEEVATTAESIAAGADHVTAAADDLSRRSSVNAANLEQVSSAIAEINARLLTSGEASQLTLSSADGALNTVGNGRTRALEAVEAISRASASAGAVDSVLDGLDKIAFQTRVLAMNAALEAGMAGEAGRGFVVVADLVSALAARAEAESQRAHAQVEATQSDVQLALAAVRGVDTSFTDIVADVETVRAQIASLTEDQGAQAAALSTASGALGELDSATRQAATKVRETADAAQAMRHEVERLGEKAAAFRYEQKAAARRPVLEPA